jgi:NitT/TauT family transport system substrate-binding protein
MNGTIRRGLTTACAIALLTIAPAFLQAQTAPRPVIRVSVNPLVYTHLPVMLAADRGYFANEGIDVVISKYNGSSNTQLPMVARGDLDVTMMVPGPGLFNQQSEGFNIKIIGTEDSGSRRGWNDATWILVRKDLWDSRKIRTIYDLRGHIVDGGPEGSPINVLMRMALRKAGLLMSDVTFTGRLATPPDWVAAMKNGSYDAISAVEPIASVLVKQGYAVRLASVGDVESWQPQACFIASTGYLSKNRFAVTAFLKAVLRAERDIVRAGPHWTPLTLNTMLHWSGLAAEDIAVVPSPAWYGAYGYLNADWIRAEQDFWVSLGLVKQKIDVAGLTDESFVTDARRQLGIR